MKNFILLALACIALIISSCNQNSPAPAPATPATAPTPTPTSTMTAAEAALVGDWIWDRSENYTSGNITSIWDSTTAFGVYKGTHTILKSSIYQASTVAGLPNYYQCDGYTGTQGASGMWYVTSNQYGNVLSANAFGCAGGNYTVTATSLIILSGYNSTQIPNGSKTFYHK